MVITITEEPVLQNDTIGIAVYELDGFVTGTSSRTLMWKYLTLPSMQHGQVSSLKVC